MFVAQLTQLNVIDSWQKWRQNCKDKIEPVVGFEKPLSQKEWVDAGEDDGDTECDQKSQYEIMLCPWGSYIAVNPVHRFSEDEIGIEVFDIV